MLKETGKPTDSDEGLSDTANIITLDHLCGGGDSPKDKERRKRYGWRLRSSRYRRQADLRRRHGIKVGFFAALLSLSLSFIPDGFANEVGKVNANFAVNPTGAATVNVPIDVPSGTAGMQPNMALSYNSQSGHGIAGFGWSIQGMQAIQRCPQTIATDGQSIGINLTNTDRFCLNGQRLMVYQGQTYGADGSYYRTEIESFQRIQSLGNINGAPEQFVVHDKAGLIHYYGRTPGLQDNYGLIKMPGEQKAFAWMLYKTEDRFGNYITYHTWQQSEHVDEALMYNLDAIDWFNNTGQRLGKISFNYAERPDKRVRYRHNVAFETLERLESIVVYGRTDQRVRSYDLTYDEDEHNRLSYLKSIQQCGKDTNTCFAPTEFDTTQALTGFSDATIDLPSSIPADAIMLDMDGDALPDYLYRNGNEWRIHFGHSVDQSVSFSTSSPTGISYDIQNAIVMDVFGDGRSDVLFPRTNNNQVWHVLSYRNDVFEFLPTGAAHYNGYATASSADVNGDGLSDIVFRNGTTTHLQVYFGTIGSNGFNTTVLDTDYVITTEQDISAIEFDGDSRAELLINRHGCWSGQDACQNSIGVLKYTDDGFIKVGGAPSSDFGNDQAPNFLLDMNGDGLTDILNYSNFSWNVYINTGLLWAHSWNTDPFGLNAYLPHTAITFDYNRDGLSDFMLYHEPTETWHAFVGNTYTGLGVQAPIPTSITNGPGGTLPRAMDTNGKGYVDILRHVGHWQVNLSPPSTPPGLIQKITDGFGAETMVSFATLSNLHVRDWVYEGHNEDGLGEADMAFPLQHFTPSMPIVRSFASNLGGDKDWGYTNYRYAGAKFHRQGRGFLGFSSVLAHNANTQTLTFNQHRQPFPFMGMIEVSEQWTPGEPITELPTPTVVSDFNYEVEPACLDFLVGSCNRRSAVSDKNKSQKNGDEDFIATLGDRISRAVNELATWQLTQSIYPFVDYSDRYEYDIGQGEHYYRRTNTDYVFDNHGNATRVTVTTSNGQNQDDHIVTTFNDYEDNEQNWCLGRLTHTHLVHDRPLAGNANDAWSPLQTRRDLNYTYDPTHCQLTSETTEQSSSQWLKKTYAYDAFGNVMQVDTSGADINGFSEQTFYDSLGQHAVLNINALGHQSSTIWHNDLGQKQSETDANGLTKTWHFDTLGRLSQESGPTPDTATTWNYQWCGDTTCYSPRSVYQVTQSESAGGYFKQDYDHLERPTAKQAPGLHNEPYQTDVLYNSIGQAYANSQPYNADAWQAGAERCWSVKHFDVLGRVTHTFEAKDATECAMFGQGMPAYNVAPNGYSVVSTIAYLNEVTTTTFADQSKTQRTVNAAGRLRTLKQTTDTGSWLTTEYGYTPEGQLAWVQNPAGDQIFTRYNDRGFKIEMRDPDTGTWHYDYNALGQLVRQTDAKGQVLSQTHDALGRLIERTELEGTTAWVYDSADGAGVGRLHMVIANDYGEIFQYDTYGQPINKLVQTSNDLGFDNFLVSHAYDNYGRVERLTYPSTHASVSLPPALDAPLSPTSLTVPSTVNEWPATISWSASTTPNVSYRLKLSAAPNVDQAYVIYQGQALSVFMDAFADVEPVANGSYHLWVEACSGGLCSAPTAANQPMLVELPDPLPEMPRAPTAPSANPSPSPDGQTMYTFTRPVGDTPIDVYEIQTSDAAAFNPVDTQTRTLACDGTQCASEYTCMTEGPTFFRTRACNAGGCGDWSSLVSVHTQQNACDILPVPNPVDSLSLGASFTYQLNGELEVFINPAGTGEAASYVKLTRSDAPFHQTATELEQQNLSCSSDCEYINFSGSNALPVGRWYFWAEACNANGCSERRLSSPTSAVVLLAIPPQPTNLLASQITTQSDVTLQWSAAVDANRPVTSIRIFDVADGHPDRTHTFSCASEPCHTATVTLEGLGLHDLGVQTCNSDGCTDWTNTVYVTLVEPEPDPPAIPAMPTNFTGPATSNGYYSIGWNVQPTDVDYIRLHEWGPNTNHVLTRSCATNCTSFNASDNPSGNWYYRVQACNVSGCSSYTNTVIVSVNNPDFGPMATPPKDITNAELNALKVSGSTTASLFTKPIPSKKAAPTLNVKQRAAELNEALASTQNRNTTPDRLTVEYRYNPLGYLHQVNKIDQNGQVLTNYWQLNAVNGYGMASDVSLADGNITTLRYFDSSHGAIDTIVTEGTDGMIQSDNYRWNAMRQLSARDDHKLNHYETFEYDALQRLTQSRAHGPHKRAAHVAAFGYQANGNMHSFATSAQNMLYTGSPYTHAQPHALRQADVSGVQRTYGYDANGNMLSDSANSKTDLSFTWASYNLPTHIESASGAYSDFSYSPNRTRVKHTKFTPETGVREAIYIDDLYQRTIDGGNTEHQQFIRVAGRVIAVENTTDTASDTHYWHHDHLQSLVAVTDDQGRIVSEQRFNAWGQARKDANIIQTTPLLAFNQGYNSHMQLDHLNLVHMRGRIYHPSIGRFISADPFVQFSESTQGFNRYSYVENNPLSYRDPSGHFAGLALIGLAKLVGLSAASQVAIAFTAGTLQGYLRTGDIGSALLFGAYQAASFISNGAIDVGLTTFGKIAVAVANQIVLSGENFDIEQVALLSISEIGKIYTPKPSQLGYRLLRSAILGGTAEKLGGGKFANGALGGLTSELFRIVLEQKTGDAESPSGEGTGAESEFAAGQSSSLASKAGIAALSTVGKLWTAPNTMVGLAVGLAGTPFGARISFANNAIQFTNLPFGNGAMTLGNVVLYGGGATPSSASHNYGQSHNLGLHEKAHTFQYELLGPLFLPVYAISGGVSAANSFEQSANRYAHGGGWMPF